MTVGDIKDMGLYVRRSVVASLRRVTGNGVPPRDICVSQRIAMNELVLQ